MVNEGVITRFYAGVCVLALAALIATAATGASAAPPRASLRAFSCQRALDPPNRSVGVTAVMRPVARTKRLALKFDLLYKRGHSSVVKSVRVGDLGTWITPKNPTLGRLPGDVWNLQKSVVELGTPATYRFRVTFRWTGGHGRVLGTVVRYSKACLQKELRPDLIVRSITVTPDPNNANLDRYVALIANAGNSAAGPFDVLFAPLTGHPRTRVVGRLGAHKHKKVLFVGPVCTTATAPTITADSASQVDDLNRANNALQATCPATSSS